MELRKFELVVVKSPSYVGLFAEDVYSVFS